MPALWAVVVAERLGRDPDTVIALGRAVAGSSARTKKAIGISESHRETGDMRGEAHKVQRKQAQALEAVRLLGRDVPVVEESGMVRALDHDRPAVPKIGGQLRRAGMRRGPAARRRADPAIGHQLSVQLGPAPVCAAAYEGQS